MNLGYFEAALSEEIVKIMMNVFIAFEPMESD